MRLFHCDHCDTLVHFENSECLNCRHKLGYLPDLGFMASLQAIEGNLWECPSPRAKGKRYRLCQNYQQQNVCNWMVPDADPNPLCSSCRLTRTIPDLKQPGNRERWYRLETAKRRLLYTLFCLRLPLTGQSSAPAQGNSQSPLTFDFLADPPTDAAPVHLTGHKRGVITINLAEADDAEREKRRLQMHEPYRTLLGHFRHEIGHYYWDALIAHGSALDSFRQRFGDERADYNEALQRHYRSGAPADWQDHFVSAYASVHPWEDWAESWAHYLHMIDTLEIALACGLSLRPRRSDDPAFKPNLEMIDCRPASFKDLIARWFSLAFVLNNLNRGMGLRDAYPFVLSASVIEKLQFIHDIITSSPRVP